MTTSKTQQKKICESCGEAFGCGAQLDDCWCADVQITAQIADALKPLYSDCLCLKCLNDLSTQHVDFRDPEEVKTG